MARECPAVDPSGGPTAPAPDRPAAAADPAAGAGARPLEGGGGGGKAAREWEGSLARLLILSDLTAILAGGAVAYLARIGIHLSPRYLATTVLILPTAWILSMSFGRTYEARFLGGGHEEFRRVVDSGMRVAALVALTAYLSKAGIGRGYLSIALVSGAVLTFAGRVCGRLLLLRMRAVGRCGYRVLVVGNGESAVELVRMARAHPLAGWNVVGACLNRPYGRRRYDRREGSTDLGDVPVLGTFADVVAAAHAVAATTVAIAECPELDGALLRRVIWELEGTGVDILVGSALTDVTGPRLSIRPVAAVPLLHVEEPELTGTRRALKDVTDRLGAAVLIALFSPLLLGLAVAVAVTSRGPVIFRQTRVGRHGEPFTMFKFRSMHVDAEARLAELTGHNERSDGLLFKMRDDPRVTRVGRSLRKWSLDELPQLFNVVAGTMSLVGPRPPLASEVARYGADVRRRLLVKPGLTGLWQISGRSDLPWDESVRLDLGYIENWSLATDLVILARTVAVVLRRSGAY